MCMCVCVRAHTLSLSLSLCPQAMSLVSTQSQSLLRYEAELAQLRGKVASMTAQMEEKDRLLLSRDKMLAEMRVQLNSNQEKAVEQLPEERKVDEDSTEKLALKVTCHLLFNIHRFNVFLQSQSLTGLNFITNSMELSHSSETKLLS